MPNSNIQHQRPTKYKFKEPTMFNVVFYNDDVTTMDFVIYVLVKIFRKTPDEAYDLMMKVHVEGCAIAGTYYYDIAMSKKEKATSLARANGFPLLITVEEQK